LATTTATRFCQSFIQIARYRQSIVGLAVAMLLFLAAIPGAIAQDTGPQKGDAFVTRFSGTRDVATDTGTLRSVIDLEGIVGTMIGLRSPGAPGNGSRVDLAELAPSVTAGQVGQVFGIAFDDAQPPNIYLIATAAFGLHRTADNSAWLPGMWGEGGGPGTVWKLNAANGYAPEIFADISLSGRPNSAAGLGNIAFDPWNRQFYVSDLETGMIHRLRASDGADLGQFDHGTASVHFVDAASGEPGSRAAVAFDPDSAPAFDNCTFGPFDSSPQCWNLADFRRRVWGLGVRRDDATGAVRLYYASWGGQGFGNPDFTNAAQEEKANAIWSVAIAENGEFDPADIRLEFTLPAFFAHEADIARAGKSQPVSDIAFGRIGAKDVMLMAERGGMLNRGAASNDSFTQANESRIMRYELDDAGIWQLAGRYDIGFYDRKNEGPPFVRAGASGGVSFGFGYTPDGTLDEDQSDGFVWATGGHLCSPLGPCADEATGQDSDTTDIAGLEGTPSSAYEAVAPLDIMQPYPEPGPAYLPTGLHQSYLVAAAENSSPGDMGDVEVYAPVQAPVQAPEGVPSAWMPPGWTPSPDYPPLTEWAPPPGWQPPPDWGPPPGWQPPPWWGNPLFPPPIPIDEPELALIKLPGFAGNLPAGAGAFQVCEPGKLCSFLIRIVNNGPAPYVGPLKFEDPLLAGWSYVSSTGPGSCQQVGVAVTCSVGQVTLAAGQSVDWTINLQLAASAANVSQIQNCAAIDWQGAPGDGNPANDKDCMFVNLKPGTPDLLIAKTGPAQCQRGSGCTYQIMVSNLGPGIHKGPVAVTERNFQFAGLKLKSYSPQTAWSCADGTIGKIICKHPAMDLLPGASLPVLTLTVDLPSNLPPILDALKDCAKITSSQGDPNTTNDESCITTPLKANFDLRVWKKGPAKCKRGAACTYEIWVRNVGSSPYQGGIVIDESNFKFAGLKLANYSPHPPWSCKDNGLGKIRCEYPSVLLPPGSLLFPLKLSVAFPSGLPDLLTHMKDCATVLYKGGKPDANPANDKACVTVELEKAPTTITGHVDWALALSELAQPWCWFTNCTTYEFLINNRGPDAYEEPMELRVEMPEGSAYTGMTPTRAAKACSGSDWSCVVEGNEIVCKPRACRLNGNETVGLKFDLRLLPNPPASPPPPGTTKTVCGTLTWLAPPASGDTIEQTPRQHTERVCGWTEIRGPVQEQVTPPPPLPTPRPKPELRCDNGNVVGGQCQCRRGWRLQVLGPNAYRCVPPPQPPRVRCDNGNVVGGQCQCRRGWRLQVLGPNAYRCVRPPQPPRIQRPAQPQLKMVPGQIICPRGTKWVEKYKKCLPIVQ